ncbi:MAG: hypothetical protein ORO03_05940, partial [Alphaproteobacteria bacterium]|nr:hypothetical protein [Alphaproteobacteria bacterium]
CAVCYNGGTCATPPTEPSCTLGTYSSTGYAPCTDAPIGTYVDTIGATSPKNCPSGKTTNQIKSTSSSQCVATACVVPAGYSEEYIIDKETYSVKLGYGVFDFGALTIPAGDYNFLLIGGGGGGGGTRGNGDNRPGGSGASGGCDSTFISSIETFYPEYRLGRGGRPSKFSFNSSNFCSYAGSISTTPGVTTTLRYLGVDYNAGGGGGGCVSGSDSGARSSGDTQCYTIAKGGTPNGVDGVVGGNRNSYSPNAGGDNGTGYGKGGDSNGMTGSAICPKKGDFGAIIVSKKCNPGTYKSNTGKGVCTPCPTGKTSIAGATSLNQCVDSTCPAGSIGLNGKAPCSKCQRGTYQDATGQQQCKDAGVDKYVDTEGATQPINCPAAKTTNGNTRATTSEQCFTRNTAPAAPTITGASYIQSGTQYDIRLNTTDAEGDKVRYNVN